MLSYPILSVALAATLALSACRRIDPPAPPEAEPAAPAPAPPVEVVRIGHAAPLTGPVAHVGRDSEKGVWLAIEDANIKGIQLGGKKVKFELVSEDDKGDPSLAVGIAQKLIDAKVAGVVGHLNSGTTIPASKVYSAAGIPQISGSSTNPTYTQQGFKTALRLIANDIQQGSVLGNFIINDLRAKRIAIIDDRTSYGQGLADEVEKAVKAGGVTVVAREFTSDTATDFKAMLKRIKAKKPEVIFHGGLDATGGPMLKQMRALGIKAQFMQGDGGCTPQMVRFAGDASNGFICSNPGLPIESMPSAQAKIFKDRFEKKFGQIQLYSPYAYDAASVMIAAMQKANSADPAKYLPELRKISYDGVTGKIEFDEKGDVKAGFVSLYEVQCGKLDLLFTLSTVESSEAQAVMKK
ncbi:MAG TPA: branched-chain amino acid ABC transporter substrate-binding protein [Burkholderiales bacterium]|nr:branched-chain amino acid ABC transporter substrate-binding protein [Burkholderiales bacterium]